MGNRSRKAEFSSGAIAKRFAELVGIGDEIFERIREESYVDVGERPACLSWLLSVINLLEVATASGNRYRAEALRLMPRPETPIEVRLVATYLGILKSASAEWSRGMMSSLELRFVGLAFEQFLDHAERYNQSGKKMDAAVLASAVLEDTASRLCKKHAIDTKDKTLDALINALKSLGVLTKVKSERLRSYAVIRNQAFHAHWDDIDQRDLHQMIEGLQELLETHFAAT